MTSPTPTSCRATTISTFRAGPMPRSSTSARSPRATPASRRWWRRRAQLRHHHRDFRQDRARLRQRLLARSLRRQADHARVSDSIAASVKDAATGETLKSLVKNDGKLSANGGLVQLSAVAARQVVDSVINTSGVIEARSIGRRQGRIVLGGATAGTKGTGAPTQTVKVSGKLNVSSKRAKAARLKSPARTSCWPARRSTPRAPRAAARC